VSSQYPTEISACVDPGADAMRLTADGLKICDGTAAPPLSGVTITCECGHVRVSVTVPKDQPAGRYVGAIKDAAGCQRGELTVEISGSRGPVGTAV